MTPTKPRRGSGARHVFGIILIGFVCGFGCGDEEKPLATWGDSSLSSEEYDAERNFFLGEGETLSQYNLDPESFLDRVVKYRILYEAASRTVTALSPVDEGRIQLYRDSIVRDQLIDETFGSTPSVTEEDIRAVYEELPIEQRRLFHFRAPSMELATAFHEAVAGGEAFDQAFQRFDEEYPDLLGGGEMGYIQKGTLPDEFEAVAWTLGEGDVSEPFESVGGHVLLCTEVRTAPYDARREVIRRDLVRQEMERRITDLESTLLNETQVSIDTDTVEMMAERVRAFRDSVPETGAMFPHLPASEGDRTVFLLAGQPFTADQMAGEMGRFNPREWPEGREAEQITSIARRRALSQIINSIARQRGLYESPELLSLVERKRKELLVNTLLRDIWRGLEATDEDIRERLAEGGRQLPGPAALADLKRQLTRSRQAEALDAYITELSRELDVTMYPERIPAGRAFTD